MKRHFFAAVLVCVVSAACNNKEDPIDGKKGRAPLNGDPVDLLRALDAASASDTDAARLDRARIQEKLGLKDEALRSWDAVLENGSSEQKDEARRHRTALSAVPAIRWDPEQLDGALRQRNEALVRQIARTYPADAVRYFEDIDLLDVATSGLLADALHEAGETYARAIVDAVIRTKDRKSLEEGLSALRAGDHQRAAELLERADNPLHLAVRFRIAAIQRKAVDALAILDSITPIATANGYRDLAGRTHTYRANVLEWMGDYTGALTAYGEALRVTGGEETTTVEILERRSANYTTIGDPAEGFRDAFRALSLLPSVEDLNARHQAYASAAWAARDLQYPSIALQFQNTAVEEAIKGVTVARGQELNEAKRHLAVALRFRAEIHVILHQDRDARADLEQASSLADAVEEPRMRDLLKMRVAEVQGQEVIERNPREAAARFTEAISLAEQQQNSTYRAVLYYKRGMARQRAGDPRGSEDIDRALQILRDEGKQLRDKTERGRYESLWKPYFSRFQSTYHQMIENRLREDDAEGAFVYAEQARAFEPMQLLLQAGPAPPGFRRIDSKADLAQALAGLPDDTLILQYLVLEDETYSWSLSRNGIHSTRHPIERKKIQEWVDRIHGAVQAGQDTHITIAMRAVYDDLFRTPLSGSRHKRIVIVPDGPMHGLPFAALESAKDGFLLERSSIATAGSTSLYLYALRRDAEFPAKPRPAVLIVREPTMDRALASRYGLGPLNHAVEEANQLHAEYERSELLAGAEATTERFLASAKNANIIHFAGHGLANPRAPWLSMLVLARQGNDAGDLTAEKLLTGTADLGQTRLIVLAACSTAFGESVGAEGLAPLVRPLIAARVPAVVGTTWDVKDTATIRELMVSLHRHYRNGDDVAVALQKAQLDILREHEPARTWAALQVIGYAGSPYARHAAQEKTRSEHIHPQDSLHRPDGLHSQ